ncbi:DUF1059 domain-containing protein [Vulgatibacter incomptus]|uniref:DUF1059 domain-containing protein n=1 Tax=Vulgatibacter incomptus TaxID=1391653 RepID=A0A0K1PFV0_9BACT|nr:DUF1059 domain-containing protein [Vulgatibacter incomptus]AKU92291.1 hypothetical protein AKJ08_2678 [Vulgatibacter incomptus]
MARKMIDCRDQKSVSGCTLTMMGEEEELLKAATQHAIQVHGHRDSPELRKMLRSSFKNAPQMEQAAHP